MSMQAEEAVRAERIVDEDLCRPGLCQPGQGHEHRDSQPRRNGSPIRTSKTQKSSFDSKYLTNSRSLAGRPTEESIVQSDERGADVAHGVSASSAPNSAHVRRSPSSRPIAGVQPRTRAA